jgi:hypothetical protein
MRRSLENLLHWRLMSENTRKNTRGLLSSIQNQGELDLPMGFDTLQRLVIAIAEDFKLNVEQSGRLKGCVFPELRDVQILPLTLGNAPAMLGGEQNYWQQFLEAQGRGDWPAMERICCHVAVLGENALIRSGRIGLREYILAHGYATWLSPGERKIAYTRLYNRIKNAPTDQEAYRIHRKNNHDWLYQSLGFPAMMGTADAVKKKYADEKKNDEKKRERVIIVLILAFLLLFFLAFFLCRILKCPCYRCGATFKPSAVGTAWGMVFLSAVIQSALMEWLGGIQDRRLILAPLQALFFKAWQSPVKTLIVSSPGNAALNCASRNDTIFNAAPALLFLYIVLSTPLFFNWAFFRLLFLSIVTITITLIKVTIKLREKHLVFYLVNLFGLEQKHHPGLSGVVEIVLLTVFTFDIDCTVTSYQYSMLI